MASPAGIIRPRLENPRTLGAHSAESQEPEVHPEESLTQIRLRDSELTGAARPGKSGSKNRETLASDPPRWSLRCVGERRFHNQGSSRTHRLTSAPSDVYRHLRDDLLGGLDDGSRSR